MDEYIDREELIRQIICSMTEFVGAPDDVQKHDEQCNYAINMIEDAPAANVAPVVHGRWVDGKCSNCGVDIPTDDAHDAIFENECRFCYYCGARMDGGSRKET